MHLEADLNHSQAVIKDREENSCLIEKDAEKLRKEVEKRERKNRLLMMEFNQHKKEAQEKQLDIEKENVEGLEKVKKELTCKDEEIDELNMVLTTCQEKQAEL